MPAFEASRLNFNFLNARFDANCVFICGYFPRRYRLAPATARLPFLARPRVVERALVHVTGLRSACARCGYRLQTACCNSGETGGRYWIRTSAPLVGMTV